MDITALAFCQASLPDAPATPVAEASTEFAEALGSVQSGAPPGPEPPPTGVKVGEEVANLGPNAQSLNPDFLPHADKATAETTADRTDPTTEPATEEKPVTNASAALLMFSASLASAAFATPTVIPVEALAPKLEFEAVTTPKINSIGIDSLENFASQPTLIDVAVAPELEVPSEAVTTPTQLGRPTPPPYVPSSNDGRWEPKSTEFAVPQDTRIKDKPGSRQVPTFVAPEQAAEATIVTTLEAVKPAPVEPAPVKPAAVNVDIEVKPQPATNVAAPLTGEAIETAAEVNAATVVEEPKPTGPKNSKKTASIDSIDASQTVSDTKEKKTLKVMPKGFESELEPPKGSTAKAGDVKPEFNVDVNAEVKVDGKATLNRKDLNLVVRQIADRMELLAATRPKNGITVQLQPAHLGSITMTVKSLAGSVEAQISASNEDVRAALDQNRPLLGQAMEQRGLRLDNVSIAPQADTSTSTQRQASQQQQQQQQHAQNSHNSSYQAASAGMTHAATTVHQARQAVRSFDGVDLWI